MSLLPISNKALISPRKGGWLISSLPQRIDLYVFFKQHLLMLLCKLLFKLGQILKVVYHMIWESPIPRTNIWNLAECMQASEASEAISAEFSDQEKNTPMCSTTIGCCPTHTLTDILS